MSRTQPIGIHAAGSRGTSNPLGLMRSSDGGRSWRKLGFARQAEFHVVAAGYLSNSLYVANIAQNPVRRTELAVITFERAVLRFGRRRKDMETHREALRYAARFLRCRVRRAKERPELSVKVGVDEA